MKTKQRAKRNPDNIEMLTELMQFSKCGPLCQLFVIDALSKHAAKIAALSDDGIRKHFEGSWVDGFAWRNAAKEIEQRLKDHADGKLFVYVDEEEDDDEDN